MAETSKRKVGRPKTKKANRIKVSITVLPDVYEKAMKKAYDDDLTFSRVVENALKNYILDDNN